MANPEQVVTVLEHWWDVELRLLGDQIIAKPRRRPLDDMDRHLIASYRNEIRGVLQYRQALAETEANILQLSDAEIEELRQELDSAPRDDPYIALDRQAFQNAMLIKQSREMEIDDVA